MPVLGTCDIFKREQEIAIYDFTKNLNLSKAETHCHKNTQVNVFSCLTQAAIVINKYIAVGGSIFLPYRIFENVSAK